MKQIINWPCYAEYVFVEWEENEDGEHSVVQGKLVNLLDTMDGYNSGTRVEVNLKDGTYLATIIMAGAHLLIF